MTEQELILLIEELLMPTNSDGIQDVLSRWKREAWRSERKGSDSSPQRLLVETLSGRQFTVSVREVKRANGIS
jgi:hypothetical protein